MKKIYLDNAATTPVADEVLQTMKPYFNEKYGNASSIHEYGREARDAVEDAREKILKKLDASKTHQLILTSGGTESNNLAIKGIAFYKESQKKGKHIITTKIEHDCVLNACKWLEKQGFEVTYLNVNKQGFVDLKELEKTIRKDTILVSIIHGNNEMGAIQNLEAIGKICKNKNVLLHSDACQSFCKTEIDLKKQNIDLLTINAHKIYGPKGVGALVIKQGMKIEPLLHGGGQEFELRSGTENTPGIVGFAKAIDVITEKDIKNMIKLRDKLISGLLKIKDSWLNGPQGNLRLCNNVDVSFKFVEGESIILHLDAKGIATSTGSACSSKSLEPSHVLTAMGLRPEEAHGSIRLTLGKDTTEKDIDYTINAVEETVENLRKISPFG